MENPNDTMLKLLDYCQANEWKGHDPYDALNSPILQHLPFLDFRLFRLALTQILKRSPINLRQLLMIPETQNPKAMALFLMSLVKLSRLGLLEREELIQVMVERLMALRSPNTAYWCWGYSFPWQTRTIVVPKWAPNLVCTTFAANALLDAYELNGQSRCLGMAANAAEYILRELYWSHGESAVGFSYPLPSVKSRVHNANFLGAALLCRIYKHCGQKEFLEPALRVSRYSASRQREDGSWDYGELSTQRWVDNFHTGYNLCALRSIGECAGTSEFEFSLQCGFEFYRNHFFRDDGAPKYFHDRTYPIDIHSAAQSIITLLVLRDLGTENAELARSVYRWVMEHMWDGRGCFHYQVFPCLTIRISYMRWSQAWMLLALSTLLEEYLLS